MNKVAGIGVALGLVAGGALVYRCMHDDEIRESVKKATAAVHDLAMTIGEYRERQQAERREREEHQTQVNQTWADQQWEALGI